MEPPPDSELRVSGLGGESEWGTGDWDSDWSWGAPSWGSEFATEVEVSVGVEILSHRVVLGWD